MRSSSAVGAGLAALALGGCGGAGTRPSAGTRSSASRPLPAVRISYDGTTCAPEWSSLKAGAYDFVLQNRGSDVIALTLLNASDGTAVTPVTPVTPGGRASIDAELSVGGSYAWRCQTPSQPPARSVAIQIPASGSPSSIDAPAAISTAQLYQPLAQYTRYVSATLVKLRGQLSTLERRLSAGDIAGAQSAWRAAHVSWLALGQDDGAYGAFGELGNQIDGTAGGDVGTTSSPAFTGFHRVELDLWSRRDLAGARADAMTLTKLVKSISQPVLSADLPLTTAALDAWVLRCHEILEDALRDTLSGQDDYGSHTGLAALKADVTATREMLRVLRGLLESRAPGLVPAATQELAAIDAATSPPRAVAVAALPRLTRERIDGAIGAALETLAPASELLQVSSANS